MEMSDIMKSEIMALVGLAIGIFLHDFGYALFVIALATLIYREYRLAKKFGLKKYSYNFKIPDEHE